MSDFEKDHKEPAETDTTEKDEGGQVRLWKEQIERGELDALAPKRPGRKPQEPDHRAKELAEKDREIQRLRERLAKAETIIEVQKKISEILSIPLNPPGKDDSD